MEEEKTELQRCGMDSTLSPTELLVQVMAELSECQVERMVIVAFDADEQAYRFSNMRSTYEEIGALRIVADLASDLFRSSEDDD